MSSSANSPEASLVRDGLVESFWSEFMVYWHRLPNKGLLFGLLGAWLLMFHLIGNATFGYFDTRSLLDLLYRVHVGNVNAEDRGPGMLAPLLVLALFWVKRKELVAVEMRSWPPAMIVLLAATLLHMLGYVVQQPKLSIIALFVGIYGIMGIAWGFRFMVASFFPYVLMSFMLPWNAMATVVTFPLRLLVTMIVEFISRNLLGLDVIRVGTGLFDAMQTYQYDVAPACSGLRSLTAMMFIAAGYGYWLFRTSWRWGVLLLAAIPLAVAGNVARLLCIVLAAELLGKEYGDWVHESTLFSMLPYLPVISGLIWLSGKLEAGHKAESKRDPQS
jgi:exosortase